MVQSHAMAMCFRFCENQGENQHEQDPCELELKEVVMVVVSEVAVVCSRA